MCGPSVRECRLGAPLSCGKKRSGGAKMARKRHPCPTAYIHIYIFVCVCVFVRVRLLLGRIIRHHLSPAHRRQHASPHCSHRTHARTLSYAHPKTAHPHREGRPPARRIIIWTASSEHVFRPHTCACVCARWPSRRVRAHASARVCVCIPWRKYWH